MGRWFHDSIVETGRLPLFCFFCGFVVGFLFIRFSVRMIRAQVRWWPGNVTPGGTHIHHVVFGVVFMLVGGVIGLALPDNLIGWRAGVAALFGIGAALVLDEFALILHLDDVYWAKAGRTSIDAVFAAIAVTGLILLRVTPIGVSDVSDARALYPGLGGWLIGAGYTLVNLALVVITLLKGKIWTGLVGIFIPLLTIIGAIRLSRPDAPWARWRYGKRPRKLRRARRREERIRKPLIRAKIAVQEFVSGKPDADPPEPGSAAEPAVEPAADATQSPDAEPNRPREH
ncbi:hypothetical protein [Actinocatenispora comari]|jgi:hypothetical protein|uniref:Membrane protein n=1 Tax=Actinocatenispora comari TaxID=2807577 RepID=A0A8J4A9L4_9ACTN|nr:hypothetical protein [Actinocatenispora comari]GIL25790.1 membrane protein [Actinocatenispora comari]